MKIALVVALLSTLVVKPVVAIDIIATDEKVTLSHVKPSLMAQWIQPEVFGVARVPVDESLSTFKLPGNWVLSPNDSNNTLDVRYAGSDKGESIEKLRDIIASLDKPIPQIEISMKLIKVQSAELGFLGMTDSEGKTSALGISSYGSAEIDKLIATKNATVITAPRVTTFNRAIAAIVQSVVGGFYSKTIDEKNVLFGYAAAKWERRWEATPQIKDDGTITLVYGFLRGLHADLERRIKKRHCENFAEGRESR